MSTATSGLDWSRDPRRRRRRAVEPRQSPSLPQEIDLVERPAEASATNRSRTAARRRRPAPAAGPRRRGDHSQEDPDRATSIQVPGASSTAVRVAARSGHGRRGRRLRASISANPPDRAREAQPRDAWPTRRQAAARRSAGPRRRTGAPHHARAARLDGVSVQSSRRTSAVPGRSSPRSTPPARRPTRRRPRPGGIPAALQPRSSRSGPAATGVARQAACHSRSLKGRPTQGGRPVAAASPGEEDLGPARSAALSLPEPDERPLLTPAARELRRYVPPRALDAGASSAPAGGRSGRRARRVPP